MGYSIDWSDLEQRIQDQKAALLDTSQNMDPERLKFLVETYDECKGESVFITRAKLFEKVLNNKKIYLDGNPIVGSLAGGRAMIYAYPEWQCNWVKDDLDSEKLALSSLGEVRFSDETKEILKKVYKTWKGKTTYDRANKLYKELYGGNAELLVKCGWIYPVNDNSTGSGVADYPAMLTKGIRGILEEVEAIVPNARFVVFDACYNGDYREDDFIAGHYIMAPGRCVTTFANSVNVLQDKSAFDLLGLLGEGLRIGAWAKNIHILESHVIGDPTYRFKAAHPELDINSMALKRNNGFWLGQLDNAIPDIQNLAMIRLWENDYPQLPAILLDKCSESPYSVVRYNAFRLLESLNGPEYKQALMLAAYDRFEFLRRIAVTRMGRIGDEAFISVLIDVYVRDRNAARIVFNISEAIRCFDKQQVEKAIETYFADKNFYHAREEKQELLDKLIERNELSPGESSTREILDPQGKPRWRQARISFLKNRPYHQHVTEYLTLLGDEQVPEILRVRMAEALAWFNLSVRRHEIADAGRKLLARGNCSPELAKEVQRMINRVESKK